MRATAIFKRILKELSRDKRTIALVFFAPLLILTLLFFIFRTDMTVDARLGVHNVDSSLVKQLRSSDKLKVIKVDGQSAVHNLKAHNLAAVLTQNGTKLTVTYQNADTTLTGQVKQNLVKSLTASQVGTIKAAMAKLQAQLPAQMQSKIQPTKPLTLHEKYIYGSSDGSLFEMMAPILVGFFVFFFVFLISGVSLLHERTTGTLNRLLTSPIKRSEIIGGYIGAYGLLATFQTIVIVTYAVLVLGMRSLGALWLVMVINLLLAIVALTLGLLISTLAASEFQMIQFIPILIIPQVFFSGLFNISGMGAIWQAVAHIFPMYYAGDALIEVIKKGANLGNIVGDLLALLGFIIILVVINIVGMKRYRRV
ncbi:MAG: ABC transporter permease [Lactobacillaceae bacterium]|jgi:ABC-2 type transport system permease protein|nr:ABC transporter permease [Lactobacillaceae bacterium]